MNIKYIYTILIITGMTLGVLAEEGAVKTVEEKPKGILTDYGRISSDLSLGTTSVRGESDSDSMNVGIDVNHDYDAISNSLEADFYYSSDEGNAQSHMFLFDAKSNYNLANDHYIFASFSYDYDRFSGFDWKIYYTLGYGHHIHLSKTMKLSLEIGPGLRKSKLHRGNRQSDNILITSADYQWKIDDKLSFREKIDVITGDEGTETMFDSELKAKIYDNVAVKLTHYLHHDSEAAAGKSDTKTITSVNLVYSF